jgi:hypothetical protein
MLCIGLWRWMVYYLISITILSIIHRPVFYLKLNSTPYVCPYLTGNTLRLRYGPNWLMLSIGSWQWYINKTITILDIIHLFISFKTRCFGDYILSSSVGGIYSDGPNRSTDTETSSFYWSHLNKYCLKTETESSLRNVVLLNKKTGRWITSKTVVVVLTLFVILTTTRLLQH